MNAVLKIERSNRETEASEQDGSIQAAAEREGIMFLSGWSARRTCFASVVVDLRRGSGDMRLQRVVRMRKSRQGGAEHMVATEIPADVHRAAALRGRPRRLRHGWSVH